MCLHFLVVDWLIPFKLKKWADVLYHSGKQCQWDCICYGCIDCVIEKEADMGHGLVAQGWGCTCTVKEGIVDPLNILIASFSRILVLLVWLTLPVTYDEVPEDVLDLVANLNLGHITYELCHRSLLPDIILKDNDKLLIRLHRIDVTH